MKMHVIQSKNRILMNVNVNLKNQMIRVLGKPIVYGIVCVIVSVMRHVKLINI